MHLIRKHSFSLLLFLVVGLAFAFPEPACEGGVLSSRWLAKSSVALILFLQGFSLATQSLAMGYRPLRLHGFVLFWNFVGFPVIAGVLLYPFSWFLPSELMLGFAALAFLPTTIASATAYTAMAGGNVANAVVSTTISNLLAVFIIPAVSVVYFRLGFSIEIPLGRVLFELVCLLIIPLALGQIVQKLVRPDQVRSVRITRRMSAGIILFVIYLAFSKNMDAGVFEQLSFRSMTMTLFAVLLLLLMTSVFIGRSSLWLKLEAPQRSAAFYCASQKSLATGLPIIASVLLVVPGMEDSAVLFIPLLCFHPAQMLIAGLSTSYLMEENQ